MKPRLSAIVVLLVGAVVIVVGCKHGGDEGKAEDKIARRAQRRDQDWPDDALQRPGVGLRHHREGRGRVLPEDQQGRGNQRPYRSTSSASTTATARRRPSSRCESWSSKTRSSFIFQSLGTPSNAAIQPYLNTNKVPQLFVATGATRWGDPEHFPWTIGFNPSYQLEGNTYGKYIAMHQPSAKIAVLYQNDDFGKDLLKGLKEGLGDKAKSVVAEASYEVSDATIDSQIATLKASGADTFVNVTTPKFAAQAIRKAYDIGWKPTQYLTNVSASVGSVLTPAGLDKSVGLNTVGYFKDPTDKQWDDDPAMKEWKAFMKAYVPDGEPGGRQQHLRVPRGPDARAGAQAVRQRPLARQRDEAGRKPQGLRTGLLLPGIKLDTSPTDFFLFDQLELVRFDGTTWVPVGDAVVSK